MCLFGGMHDANGIHADYGSNFQTTRMSPNFALSGKTSPDDTHNALGLSDNGCEISKDGVFCGAGLPTVGRWNCTNSFPN